MKRETAVSRCPRDRPRALVGHRPVYHSWEPVVIPSNLHSDRLSEKFIDRYLSTDHWMTTSCLSVGSTVSNSCTVGHTWPRGRPPGCTAARKKSESEAAVNLSFSFRRPSTDCYRTARAGSVDEWIMTTDSQAASPYERLMKRLP